MFAGFVAVIQWCQDHWLDNLCGHSFMFAIWLPQLQIAYPYSILEDMGKGRGGSSFLYPFYQESRCFPRSPHETFISITFIDHNCVNGLHSLQLQGSLRKWVFIFSWWRWAKEKRIGNDVWIIHFIMPEYQLVQEPVFAYFFYQSTIRIGIPLLGQTPPDDYALTTCPTPTHSLWVTLTPINYLDCHLQWSGYPSCHCLLLAWKHLATFQRPRGSTYPTGYVEEASILTPPVFTWIMLKLCMCAHENKHTCAYAYRKKGEK